MVGGIECLGVGIVLMWIVEMLDRFEVPFFGGLASRFVDAE